MSEIEDLENKAMQEGFWDDMQESQKVLQKTKQLKDKVAKYNSLYEQWEDTLMMIDLANEENDETMLEEITASVKEIKNTIETMTLETLLSGKYDSSNAIIEFHAGAGGTEAQDWCSMLIRMYQMWAQKRGFTTEIIDSLDGDEAGIKSCTMEITGLIAYGYLKSEKGVHRLVRISPFNSAGKRMTSFASIGVMPELDDNVEVDIRAEDIKMDTFRASGAGGQHINKTDSAIRILHKPTGIVVGCQTERSQLQNKETAMRMLKAKLVEIKEREHLDRIEDIQGEKAKIEWGAQIRSYVFMPYTLVKDTRTGCETADVDGVMDGDLDAFINSYLKMNANK